MKRIAYIAAVVALTFSLPSVAADSGSLGPEFTPSGGEKAGNSAGTIPAWNGGVKAPDGWNPTTGDRYDSNPFKGEAPLFSIDASNVDKYADHLAPGQILQLKQNKGYRMDVYPTHRTCGVPDFVAANTAKNIGFAKIGADGSSLAQAYLPGVPFPKPQNGIEAVWNFLARYQGVGLKATMATYISPRSGSSDPIVVVGPVATYWPSGAKGTTTPGDVRDVLFADYGGTDQPAALAGQGFVQTSFFSNKSAESFFYFAGQRRVRRMPTYDHDAPLIGYDNQYLDDQVSLFNGAPDRYDWKIIGKKEIYVPYNNFAMYNPREKLSRAMGPQSLIPSVRRYELHRVLEIEGTVKAGMRNISAKRTLYLDEDSWIVLESDMFDSSGKIWKVGENYPIPVWELGACAGTAMSMYDTSSGRYLVDATPFDTGKPFIWYQEGKGGQFEMNFYGADALQSRSER
ncbi:DUF1329 domain-containing protein [Paraburkholderia acidiphila]|uniref:DUF1329 domain-containing protein n=1 Tax=Paraburkholderia acidiphila TaxID=2571747 RepID=A0A7Z2J9L7_9BURK|nr:DUF1329 domain-containing protein [Paraburkholderia acidiphila]QGZ56872.1 DUF1329 domain-containing protein [Paraburkholderia acidiphila]